MYVHALATIGKRNGSDSFSLFEIAQKPLRKPAQRADINQDEEYITHKMSQNVPQLHGMTLNDPQ